LGESRGVLLLKCYRPSNAHQRGILKTAEKREEERKGKKKEGFCRFWVIWRVNILSHFKKKKN